MARTLAGSRTAVGSTFGRFSLRYKETILAAKPQVYWRLGETTGTTATSLGSIAYDGTYTNSTGYTLNQTGALSGDTNPSVLLTRANAGYIHGPSILSGQTAARSFECWVKGVDFNVTFANNQGLMGDQNNANTQTGWYFYVYSANVIYGCYGSEGTPGFRSAGTGALLSAGVWHHMVGTWDGLKTFNIYIDGTLSGQTVYGTNVTPVASTTALDAGRAVANGGGNYLNGNLDEVAIYTRALSAGEANAHYRIGAATLARTAAATRTLA